MKQFLKLKSTEVYFTVVIKILLALAIWLTLESAPWLTIWLPVAFFSSRIFLGGFFPNVSDNIDKYTFILILQLIMFPALVAYLYFINTESYGYLILVIFLLGVIDAYYAPTVNALIPDMVREEQLHSAYRISFFLMAVSNAAGLTIGFAGYEVFNLNYLILVLLAACVPMFALNFGLKKVCFDFEPSKLFVNPLKNFREYRAVKFEFEWSICSLIINSVVVAFSTFIIPLAVKEVMDASSIYVGLMEAAVSLGIIIGSIYVHKELSRFLSDRVLVIASLSVLSFCFLLYSFALNKFAWMITSIIFGVALVVNNTTVESKRSIAISEKNRGMFQTIHSLLIQAGVPVGLLISKVISDRLSIEVSLVAGFLTLFVVVVYLACSKHTTDFLRTPLDKIGGYYDRQYGY